MFHCFEQPSQLQIRSLWL